MSNQEMVSYIFEKIKDDLPFKLISRRMLGLLYQDMVSGGCGMSDDELNQNYELISHLNDIQKIIDKIPDEDSLRDIFTKQQDIYDACPTSTKAKDKNKEPSFFDKALKVLGMSAIMGKKHVDNEGIEGIVKKVLNERDILNEKIGHIKTKIDEDSAGGSKCILGRLKSFNLIDENGLANSITLLGAYVYLHSFDGRMSAEHPLLAQVTNGFNASFVAIATFSDIIGIPELPQKLEELGRIVFGPT